MYSAARESARAVCRENGEVTSATCSTLLQVLPCVSWTPGAGRDPASFSVLIQPPLRWDHPRRGQGQVPVTFPPPEGAGTTFPLNPEQSTPAWSRMPQILQFHKEKQLKKQHTHLGGGGSLDPTSAETAGRGGTGRPRAHLLQSGLSWVRVQRFSACPGAVPMSVHW